MRANFVIFFTQKPNTCRVFQKQTKKQIEKQETLCLKQGRFCLFEKNQLYIGLIRACYLVFPTKNSASVPGPECAPITGDISVITSALFPQAASIWL